jgi:hypothetical protein
MLGMMCVIALCLQSLSLPAQAQVFRAFTPRFSTNDNGDILIIGNTLFSCPTSDNDCADGRNGIGNDLNNNDFNMVNVNVAGGNTNSSSADLRLPPGASVLWVGLYWGAQSSSSQRNRVRFATPLTSYNTKTGSIDTNSNDNYQGFVEVTTEVQASGSGTYRVADVAAQTGTNRYAGWALVVVIQDPTEPLRNLTIFDGFANVSEDTPVTTTVSGFITPLNGAFTTRMGGITYEGDVGLTGDAFQFNGPERRPGRCQECCTERSDATRAAVRRRHRAVCHGLPVYPRDAPCGRQRDRAGDLCGASSLCRPRSAPQHGAGSERHGRSTRQQQRSERHHATGSQHGRSGTDQDGPASGQRGGDGHLHAGGAQ